MTALLKEIRKTLETSNTMSVSIYLLTLFSLIFILNIQVMMAKGIDRFKRFTKVNLSIIYYSKYFEAYHIWSLIFFLNFNALCVYITNNSYAHLHCLFFLCNYLNDFIAHLLLLCYYNF